MPDQLDPHAMVAVRGVLLVIWGFPIAIAAWWLFLFLRPGVKQQFSSAGATPASSLSGRPAYPFQDFLWFIAIFSSGLAAAASWFLIKHKAAFAH